MYMNALNKVLMYNIYINVGPPVVVSIMEPAPVLGSSHTLTCSFTTALSSPVVQWRNGSDGALLTSGGGITVSSTAPYQLTFNQLVESHLGDYYCEVTVGDPGSTQSGCFIDTVGK